jgi:hypothetical protein
MLYVCNYEIRNLILCTKHTVSHLQENMSSSIRTTRFLKAGQFIVDICRVICHYEMYVVKGRC